MRWQIVGPRPRRVAPSAPDPARARKARLDAAVALTMLDATLRGMRCETCGAGARSTRVVGGACDRCAAREMGVQQRADTNPHFYSTHPGGRVLGVR
jgi:hypothetical protein